MAACQQWHLSYMLQRPHLPHRPTCPPATPLTPAVPRPSTAGPPPAASSGRDSPAVTDDLAQSLASLKIALTQQQLAAAAGSVSWGCVVLAVQAVGLCTAPAGGLCADE